MQNMEIATIVTTLELIAPLTLAGPWDNTGLILEGDRPIERVMVTIDLSEAVANEAREKKVDLLVCYHPPIFSGLKSLTALTSHGPALLGLLRKGVHVYSPHTALDAAAGGINDWLVAMFPGVTDARPIVPDELNTQTGAGRIVTIDGTTLGQLVPRIKNYLGLDHLRISGELDTTVHRVAVCPGNGTSLFKELSRSDAVDLVLTGEMSHHDVIRHRELGHVVIISEHSHTERGFLPVYANRIQEAHPDLTVLVSESDRDPLQTV